MIFRSIELENFRQFSGKQKIGFSTDAQRNVTVLHGFNGAGKTTFLNAFTWLLYQSFSQDFSDTERLANEAEWNKLAVGSDLQTSVKAHFEHNEREYIAERVHIATKLDGSALRVKDQGTLRLSFMGKHDGELRPVNNPEDHIRQLLPPQLAPFFFFNGERIEQLASPSAYEKVETGIKVLLDIELLERSVRHLRTGVSESFSNDITDKAGEQGKDLRRKREQVEASHKSEFEKLGQMLANKRALEQEREVIDAKLRAEPELAGLQKERDEKRQAFARVQGDLKRVQTDMAARVSEDGYLPLGDKVLTKALRVLDEAHKEGELPPPIKRQFVEELLQRNACICARDLNEGTPARTEVEAWRDKSRSDEFARIATTSRAEIKNALRQRLEKFWKALDGLAEYRTSLLQEKDSLNERLSEISTRIGEEASKEDYQALEVKRRNLESDLLKWEVEAAEQRKKVKDLETQGKDIDHDILKLDHADAQGKLAQKRLEAVNRVADVLEQIRDIRQEAVRADVSDSVSEIWNSISIKNYNARLGKDYRLQLTKEVGGVEESVRGASTGEKQVLSLAFVASLAKKAQELQHEARRVDSKLFVGGQYPLVMDSPFGSLEVDYRREVAKHMPNLAPQIIVMVSESQWRNEVEAELKNKIGKAWIMECHTAKHHEKTIELRGTQYPYVTLSADGYEGTTFTEVE